MTKVWLKPTYGGMHQFSLYLAGLEGGQWSVCVGGTAGPQSLLIRQRGADDVLSSTMDDPLRQ